MGLPKISTHYTKEKGNSANSPRRVGRRYISIFPSLGTRGNKSAGKKKKKMKYEEFSKPKKSQQFE
jgi:hypothetical protein